MSGASGGWSVSLPALAVPTTFQATVLGDQDDAGSTTIPVTAKVPTETTVGVTVAGGRVTVHGSVLDGLGTGQPGMRVDILAGPAHSSAMRTLGSTTTDSRGRYAFTAAACTTACDFETIAPEDAVHVLSWAISGAVKAPTLLGLTARAGRPDYLTVGLSYAATRARIAGQKIFIYYRYAGHRSWIRQKILTTDRNGQATGTEQPRHGRYFTARYAGTSAIASAASRNVYLRY